MPRTMKRKPARWTTHRAIAEQIGVDTSTLIKWVHRGEWPEPMAIIARTWFYDAAAVDHYLATGRWPAEVCFRRVPSST